MTADTSDWVSFEEADTFQPSGINRAKQIENAHRRSKKRSAKKRSARVSSETNTSSASWMERPVNDDSSWLPVAPPQYEEVLETRDDSESRASNSTPSLSRPPRAVQRGSSASSDGNSNPASSLSSGSQNRPIRTPRERAKERRGRARERRTSRDRAGSETRDKPPSTSRTRSNSRTRGRSSSRTRSVSQTRTRSSSRTRVESVSKQHRGRSRSTSRTRVEPPSPRCHSRARSSTPRTRVASPSPVRRISPIPPMPNTEPRGRGNNNPSASTTRSRPRSRSLNRAMSLSPRNCSNRSVQSAGNGFPPRHNRSMADRSVSSEQLGVRQRNGLMSASSPKPPRKEGGLLERFFGDQVTEEAKNGYRNNSTVRSSVSVGSLRFGEAQQSESIHPRVLLSATVYKNAATGLWITTINTNQKGVATNPKLASKYLKAFSFPSEQEAREAAIANAPPKMMPFEESPICFVCKGKFAVFRRACHCRNCGACVCGGCTTTWSSKMLPETYNLKNESVVKVCKSCSYLTDSFRKALLAGNIEEAIDLYHTGNVNLRCPLPPAEGSNKKVEIMYPIHCAVQGGNLDIVRWLMDEHFCPIKLVKKNNGKGRKPSHQTSIVTSKGRSALHLAMNGRKVDIIRYLVVDKGIPVYEMKDLHLSLRALEAVLLAFPASQSATEFDSRDLAVPRWDETNYSGEEGSYVCSSLGEDESNLGEVSAFNEDTPIETVDLCILCYDNPIDSVITPCGHQICCLACSTNLKTCPVCNVECNIIQIFKP